MSQLFDSDRRSRFDRPNPPPIKARKQGFELGVGQRDQSILDARPGKAVLFKPFVGHDDTGAIPVDQLQPIRLAGPEHEDRSCERVLVQFVLHQCRQSVMPLPIMWSST